MPKDLIRLNNSQACAACNPLHRRRVLMVSLSFTEVIRKHVSFQPPETCSLHAVWAERPASLPPHFLSSWSHFLLCSPPLLLFLSLFYSPFLQFRFIWRELWWIWLGWHKVCLPVLKWEDKLLTSLLHFKCTFSLFQVVTKPMLFLQVLKDLKVFMNLWPWLAHLPNTNSWNMCLPYAESK